MRFQQISGSEIVLRKHQQIIFTWVTSHFIICLPSTNAVMYTDIWNVPTKKYRTQKSSHELEKDCASITSASAARDMKKTFLLPNLMRHETHALHCGCVSNSGCEFWGGNRPLAVNINSCECLHWLRRVDKSSTCQKVGRKQESPASSPCIELSLRTGLSTRCHTPDPTAPEHTTERQLTIFCSLHIVIVITGWTTERNAAGHFMSLTLEFSCT